MPLDKVEQNVVDNVARVGWSLILVEADAEGPSFVYSIGMMHTLDHPEVIMFGLSINLMAAVINGMGDEIRCSRRFDEAGLYDGLVEGYACKCVAVAAAHHREFFGYAAWHRRHVGQSGTLRAVQCLWPDRAGLFPDERGCHPSVVERQPLLGEP